jgi:Uma2 family endonuclease
MAETGVLNAGARVELVDGDLIDMAPTGTRHDWTVVALNRRLQRAVGDAAIVAIHAPLRLGEHSEPEQDVALLKPATYANALLVIEVSDTTLAYDVRIKAPLYARHGVAGLWVLDLAGGLLRCFGMPQGEVYTEVTVLDRPGTVALPGLPGCNLDFSGVF